MKGTILLKMNKTLVVLLVLIGLLGISSVAVAEHDDTHPEHTLFSFGYDDFNHFLAINIDPNDTLYKCIFENGTLQATYGNEVDGFIQVDKLDEGTTVRTPKEFDPRPQAELADGLTEELAAASYTGATGECGVKGVVVAGPNGQINHGQFMKAAKSLFDIKGGCMVRHLAKSNIAKGNDPSHLTVSEAEALAFEFGGVGTIGDIDFTTEEVDCNRGKKDKEAAAESASSGRTKGKSADAPGRNK